MDYEGILEVEGMMRARKGKREVRKWGKLGSVRETCK